MVDYTNDAALATGATGALVTPANSAGGSNTAFNSVTGTVDFSTAYPLPSSRSYFMPAPIGIKEKVALQISTGLATAKTAVQSYWRFVGTVAPTITTIWVQLDSTGKLYLGITTAGKIVVVDNVGTKNTSTYVLAAGIDYRLDVYWEVGANSGAFKYALFNDAVSTTVPVSTYSATIDTGSANPWQWHFGKVSTTGNWCDSYLKNIKVRTNATDYIGLPVNAAPTVNAGDDQTTEPYLVVSLIATDADTDGTIATRSWRQISGPTVYWGVDVDGNTPVGATIATTPRTGSNATSFVAPGLVDGGTAVFGYKVTDDDGAVSTEDTMSVVILPVTELAAIGGVLVPMQVLALEAGVPSQDLDGWTLALREDFSQDAALGQFGTVYGGSGSDGWRGYDNTFDTSHNGLYSPDRILSVANNQLDVWLHYDATVVHNNYAGTSQTGWPLVAAPLPTGKVTGQLYGRYWVRYRSPVIEGYKIAFLLWPDSDNWNEGEIDMPEANLFDEDVISGYVHQPGNPTVNALASSSSVVAADGNDHITLIEWTPSGVTFWVDGVQMGHTAVSPSESMHLVLQAETQLSGGVPPHDASGHLLISGVVIWAYTP